MTDYERVDLADRIVTILSTAGLEIFDEEKVQRFVNEMVDDQDKVHDIKETQATKFLVHFFENEADMDDLAREYSRILGQGRIRVVRDFANDERGSSDVFLNGERVRVVDDQIES